MMNLGRKNSPEVGSLISSFIMKVYGKMSFSRLFHK